MTLRYSEQQGWELNVKDFETEKISNKTAEWIHHKKKIMHVGKSSNLRYAALGPVPTLVIQEENLAVKIASQIPTQNLPGRGEKGKSNIRNK